ncbi:Uncharacterized protein ACO02O_07807 [Dirofilaria immitis]
MGWSARDKFKQLISGLSSREFRPLANLDRPTFPCFESYSVSNSHKHHWSGRSQPGDRIALWRGTSLRPLT